MHMSKEYMDRPTTNAIRGIALIFMFIHHFFTIPDYYVSGISYPELEKFALYFSMPLKICVPVFAFMTGYFYYSAKERTFRYSLRKITDLLVPYWAVYLPFLCLAIALGCHKFNIVDVGMELFALRRSIMCFCWYVFFYYFSMLLLPLLTRFPGRSLLADAALLLLIPAILWITLSAFLNIALVQTVVAQMQTWFPCIAVGYLCAKYSVFTKIDAYFSTFNSKTGVLFGYLLMTALAFFGCKICAAVTLGSVNVRRGIYELQFSMEMIYGPMFVYGVAKLLQFIKGTLFFRLLGEIGKKSMLMWFIHCIFFNICKEKTQRILYFPKNPVLVVFFGLALCYGLTALIEPGVRFMLKKKNGLMDRKKGDSAEISGHSFF